jgi:ABC-type uncharacterized transport system permease subunit
VQYALFFLAVAAYFAATLAFYLSVLRPRTNRPEGLPAARRLLWLAVALQFADIGARSVVTRTCPVSSANFGLGVAALVATLTFLLWAKTEKQLSLGVVLAPVGLTLHVASLAFGRTQLHTRVPSWYLAVHVTCSLIGVGLFVLAAAAAVAYLIQSTRLKAKRASLKTMAFPGLTSLESFGHRCLGIGLGPMTLGVVSGAVFAERLSQSSGGTLRIVLSYACWFTAALVVLGQKVTGWHGRRVAWGTIVAAVLAVGSVLLYALTAGGQP